MSPPVPPQDPPGERTWTRWRRRAVTLPALALLTALGLALFPVLAPLALIADLVRGRRLALLRALTMLLFVLLCECVGVLAAFVLWLWLWPGGRAAFLRRNYRLQALWCAALYRGGERLFGMRTVVEGTPPARGPLLCFVRHASIADTLLPVLLLGGRLAPRYVLKRELLLDPCLDVVGCRLPNCFVRRSEGRSGQEAARVVALAAGMGEDDMLVIYPEGTRFTRRKREALLLRMAAGPEAGQAAALAAALRHTLPPLRGGPLALLRENPGADLLVLGHTGLEPAGTLGSLLSGGLIGQTVRVRLWHVPFAELPREPAAQAALLERLWREVDAFIDQHQGQRQAQEQRNE